MSRSNSSRRHGDRTHRRTFLKGAGVAGLTSGLAGCLGGGSGDGDSSETTTTESTTTESSDSTSEDPVSLTYGTFKEKTAWYVEGSAIAENVKPRLPDGSSISVKPYAGTYGNIELLRKGEADIAMGTAVVNRWASQSKYYFEGKETFDGLRSIVGHLDLNWIPTAMKKSVAEEKGISSYGDIKDKQADISIGVGPAGSISHRAAQHIYGAHGFSLDDAKGWGAEVKQFALPDMPSALDTGKIDALTYVASPGHPVWTEMSSNIDLVFLPIENLDYLNQRGWSRVNDLPEGMFGATSDKQQVGFRSLIMTTRNLPDHVAGSLAETVVEEIDSLEQAYASMEHFDPELGVKDKWLGAPLHPGAKSYFESEGYL